MSDPTTPFSLSPDTPCIVVAHDPPGRWGPYRLRTAVLNVVQARPPGAVVEIHVENASPLAENSIRELYVQLASRDGSDRRAEQDHIASK